MGGLRKRMPITWICALAGSLALVAIPGFSGFYSKDAIIEAVHLSETPGAGFAYLCVLLGVFVTAVYSFRMFFLVFHGNPRMDSHTKEHLRESPAVVTVPLILLALPSLGIGWFLMEALLFGGYFDASIIVDPERNVLAELGEGFHGVFAFTLHGLATLPFWLAAAGVVLCWFLYMKRPELPERISTQFNLLYRVLMQKYGFDEFYEAFFAGGARNVGSALWRIGDAMLIDGLMVNGTARVIGWFSGLIRHVQTGYLYHYAFAMIIGLLLALTWFLYG